MTLLQPEASAQAPWTSTITGLAECPPPVAAAPAEARAGVARPGAIASRAAARATARSAGKAMRRVVRLTDMSAPLLGMGNTPRLPRPGLPSSPPTRQHWSPANPPAPLASRVLARLDLPMYCRACRRMAGQNTLIG